MTNFPYLKKHGIYVNLLEVDVSSEIKAKLIKKLEGIFTHPSFFKVLNPFKHGGDRGSINEYQRALNEGFKAGTFFDNIPGYYWTHLNTQPGYYDSGIVIGGDEIEIDIPKDYKMGFKRGVSDDNGIQAPHPIAPTSILAVAPGISPSWFKGERKMNYILPMLRSDVENPEDYIIPIITPSFLNVLWPRLHQEFENTAPLEHCIQNEEAIRNHDAFYNGLHQYQKRYQKKYGIWG